MSKNKKSYYFPLCMGIGIAFGAAFNQIPIGLCMGVVIGLSLDEKNKRSN